MLSLNLEVVRKRRNKFVRIERNILFSVNCLSGDGVHRYQKASCYSMKYGYGYGDERVQYTNYFFFSFISCHVHKI